MRSAILTILLLACAAGASAAQGGPSPIADNSFLLEEAYNQDPGVVQHVSAYLLDDEGEGWEYTFSQEWPLWSQRHQLSFAVPVLYAQGLGRGLGDVSVGYRYQALGVSGGRTAVAPRLELSLPIGSEARGRGAGAVGVELGLPLSVRLGRALVAHTNASVSHAFTDGGSTDVSAGQSVVWLAHPNANLLLEGVWSRADVGGDDEDGLFLSPGVRGALNLRSGAQVVPGIAVPIGVGPSSGERFVFFYLSVEHAFR